MSVSVVVEKGKPFQISAIIPKVEKALKLILGLTYEPKLTVDFVRSAEGETDLPEAAWIRPGMREGFSVTLGEERTTVGVYTQEGLDYVGIAPYTWQALALGAAIATAIAEYSDSEVCDSQSTYTIKEYLKPDEFLQSIRVDKAFDEINEATEYFFSHLPCAPKKK